MSNNNKNSNALLFFGGLALGAAVGYFYNTPKGQKMKDDLIDKGIDVKNNLSDKAEVLKNEAKSKAKKAISAAADALENVQEKMNDSASDAIEITEKRLNKLQKGINKAKSAIQNGSI